MDEVATIQLSYATQLWTLSNTIAAFSVLQTLPFLWAFQKNEFRNQVGAAWGLVATAICLSSVCYVSAITIIDYYQIQIIKPTQSGQVVEAIFVVTGLKILAVIGSGVGALALVESVRPNSTIKRWFQIQPEISGGVKSNK